MRFAHCPDAAAIEAAEHRGDEPSNGPFGPEHRPFYEHERPAMPFTHAPGQ
jgi:hypothetical protein